MTDTSLVIRLDRFNEIKRKFPEEIDRILKEGSEEISSRADSQAPGKVPVKARKTKGGYEVAAGSSKYFFGGFVEFGTVFQVARPFMTPAAESVFPRLIRQMHRLERVL